LVLSRE